jgi:mxaJ protein
MSRLLLIIASLVAAAEPAAARELKVCADPNNLPFSNAREEGFENKIARIVADELGASLTYVWHAQRRGNVRETLNEGLCDLIPGVASSLEMLGTTKPYYRSTYVAVARKGPLSDLDSFDDQRLAGLKIGVQLIGDDGANTPPAHSLSRRGMIDNIRGFSIYGDYGSQAPQSPIVDAVARGEVDLAFVWGPTAGYFAKRQQVPLTIAPVRPRSDGPTLPMHFDISMGVRRDDRALKREVEAALDRRAADVRAVLVRYGLPLVSPD